MGDFARKADGRRVFTAEFKRATVARVHAGETTVAVVQVADELDGELLTQSEIFQNQSGVVPEEGAEEQEDDSVDGHRAST